MPRNRLTEGKFGSYGGSYIPETLVPPIQELETAYSKYKRDPLFKSQLRYYLNEYAGRPTPLYYARNLTRYTGGARIYLKREDLLHGGAHKINNTLGQGLLAKRMGKKRIIAETGAGQHGVATSIACGALNLSAEVYMGLKDTQRQSQNVLRMQILGAKVHEVSSGSQTLKDAINEALRDWIANVEDTYYLIGSVVGPHPYPTIVRDFQSVIGSEIESQTRKKFGRLPDAVVACVGGGSNAIGSFYPLLKYREVSLYGIEAGGEGLNTKKHSASLNDGTVGVLHGMKSYLLQDKFGQVLSTHSISAGLDYPGVGPEHAYLKDSGRVRYASRTDREAIDAFMALCKYEGIIPALESSHALAYAMKLAKKIGQDKNIVVTLSGRGDKDIGILFERNELSRYGVKLK